MTSAGLLGDEMAVEMAETTSSCENELKSRQFRTRRPRTNREEGDKTNLESLVKRSPTRDESDVEEISVERLVFLGEILTGLKSDRRGFPEKFESELLGPFPPFLGSRDSSGSPSSLESLLVHGDGSGSGRLSGGSFALDAGNEGGRRTEE